MIKRCAILAVFAFMVLLGGCETAKGVAGGFAVGVYKDSTNTWDALKKADRWMRENLW